jgi:hypothetical protein
MQKENKFNQKTYSNKIYIIDQDLKIDFKIKY